MNGTGTTQKTPSKHCTSIDAYVAAMLGVNRHLRVTPSKSFWNKDGIILIKFDQFFFWQQRRWLFNLFFSCKLLSTSDEEVRILDLRICYLIRQGGLGQKLVFDVFSLCNSMPGVAFWPGRYHDEHGVFRNVLCNVHLPQTRPRKCPYQIFMLSCWTWLHKR